MGRFEDAAVPLWPERDDAIPEWCSITFNSTSTRRSELAAGGAACVAYPYRARELVPILRSIRLDEMTSLQPVLECGGLKLDPGLLEVRLHGRRIRMPMRELRLLQVLMTNGGRVLTREQIINTLWGGVPGSNTVTVHVQRL